ncbi:MAG: YdbH domain-containing protein [Sphingopyxis sp.]
MRKRAIIAMALLGGAALAALIAWLNRGAIVEGYVDSMLAEKGVDASYHIDHIGLGTQRLTNVVIGDPARPDLTASIVEITMQYGITGPSIASVRASGVRLRGRWTGDKLSFGAVDKLLPDDDSTPPELPDIALMLVDAGATIDTPWGRIGLGAGGSGRLRDGFMGRVAVLAPRLSIAGCLAEPTEAMLRLKIIDQVPRLTGPMGVRALSCAAGGKTGAARVEEVRIGLEATVPLSLEGAQAALRLRTGAATAAQNRLVSMGGVVDLTTRGEGSYGANWTLHGFNPSAAWGSADGVDLSGEGTVTEGGAMAADGTMRLVGLRGNSDYTQRLARLSDATQATPIGPIAAQFSAAMVDFGRRASASGSYHYAGGGPEGRARLRVGNISVDAGSGAYLQITRPDAMQWQPGEGARFALVGRFGGGGLPRGRFDVRSAGASQAAFSGVFEVEPMRSDTSSLVLSPMRFSSDGGGTRFSTAATMSGPLGRGGRIDGLAFPLDGRIAPDGSAALSGGCRTVGWRRATFGSMQLDGGAMQLCGEDGQPLLRYDNSGLHGHVGVGSTTLSGDIGGTPMAIQADSARLNLSGMRFTLAAPIIRIGDGDGATRMTAVMLSGVREGAAYSGTLNGASGNIGSVPFLFDQAGGDWRWQSGELTLSAALQVTDAAADDRFQPLRSDDTQISYQRGAVHVTGSLHEPTTRARIADVTIDHRFSDGRGGARFAIAGLNFTHGGLQPVLLTKLSMGVAADAEGGVSGSGRVDWTSEGVSNSSGDFATDAMDLAAAFGPVQRMAGAIHFSDLIALATPPGQEVRLGSVNPGVEVTDGVMRYQLLPDSRVQVESAIWPFAGGQLLLRPTTLNFATDVPRFLTFDVQGVDAGLFLSRYEFDNIHATGVFDGTLPTKFTSEGGRVEGGLLTARSGGSLEVVGELAQRDLGFFGNLAFGALRSLRYDGLAIRMNGNIDGEMLTTIGFTGLAQGEGAHGNIITRAFRRLPITFNININAPFRQLLSSARTLYDPTIGIEANVGALVRAEREAAAANAAQSVQPSLSEDRR